MLYDPKWEVEIENDTVTILRKALDIISNPAHWTCYVYARDSSGREIAVDNASAVSFCSVGALAVASGTSVKDAEHSISCKFLEEAASEVGCPYAHELNDKGHSRAMSMFNRAIELARAAPSSQRADLGPTK